MMNSKLSVFIVAALLPTAWGHARVNSPPIRGPGNDLVTTCGQASFDTITRDATGHIEEQTPFNSGTDCQPTLCRGMLFSDQPATNVQSVTPGQAMEMKIDCTIPHGGPANVSLVDTTVGGAGVVIGSFLKTFDDFCPTSGSTPADQTDLKFNLPSATDIGDKCQKAGDCVVQLFWATPDLSQNYYYCVDVSFDQATGQPSTETATTSQTVVPTASSPEAIPQATESSTIPEVTPSLSTIVPEVTPEVSAPVPEPTLADTQTGLDNSVTDAPVANAPAQTNSGFVTVTTTSTSTPLIAPTGIAESATSGGVRRRHRLLWMWV
jgi:hypothetical protein